MENKVTVVDSIMGSGKTTWAIQYINEHPEISFIYCTPFLSEAKRISENCNRIFYEPDYKNGGRKLDDFNSLLMEGKDIVVTHCTFSNSNQETLEHLANGNYCLILDEVLDILVSYKDVCKDELKSGDIKLLINEGFIKADKYGKVSWVRESYPGSKYFNVERLAKNGTLFYLDKTMLVWQFPPQIFNLFKNVYLLTYLFEGSFLKPYFEYHQIPYELSSISKDSDDIYYLTDYNDSRITRKSYKNLITILDHKKLNDYKASSLSKAWYERKKKSNISVLTQLKNNLLNYFQNITKAKASDILWTCPKDYKKYLKGKGYTIIRKLTADEKAKPQKERELLENKLNCFIPSNTKAVNDFSDRSVLAYMMNMYINPYVKRYFENKNNADNTTIHINQEYFALSCMIQWIWRSRIRNNQPIQIYIPSARMRDLLIQWLDGKM